MKTENLDAYKWIKIGQSLILILLGALFVVTAILNRDTETSISTMLSISIGIIVAVYGLLDILSGYLLYRNPYNTDVILGEVMLALATVLFIKRDIITEVLSYFVAMFMIYCAAMLILHGVILIVSNKSKSKPVFKITLSFILAALVLGAGIVYLILYIKNPATVEIYMLLILGFVLIAIGIALLSLLIVKIKNTNKSLKEQEIKKQQEFKINNSDRPTNTNVKIIDVSDLKKKNKLIEDEEEDNSTATSIIVLEDDDSKDSDNK